MSKHALQFHRDAQGALHAEAPDGATAGRLLAQFFETDVAGDRGYCQRLLEEGARHAQTPGHSWHTSGNAFAVNLEAAHVTLRPLFGKHDHDHVKLPTSEFFELVEKWQQLIG